MARRSAVDPRFGPRVRRLREQRGLSLQGLARTAFVSKSHISEIENGVKGPSVGTATALDRALQANGELVGMVDRSGCHVWWGPGDTIEMIERSTQADLLMNRRQAAHALGGMVFGAALLESLDRWVPASRATGSWHVGAGGINEMELAEIEHTAMVFRGWDHRFGGGLRKKAVIGQLNEIAGILGVSRGPYVKRLLCVMAQLAETVATMFWDTGNDAAAQRYYSLALRAAKEGGDRQFAANVLAGMARQLLYLGHPGDALELVRIAQETLAGHAPSTVRAMLFTREAWAYAKQGRVTALRRTTDKARAALAEADPVEDPYWMDYFDAAELAGVTGGRLLELAHNDPSHAGTAAEHILYAVQARDPHHLRSLALDKIGLAEARLLQREVEEAARLGHEAVQTAERTASDRVRVKLEEFYEVTRHHDRVPEMAELRDRVRPQLALRRG